MTDEEKIAGAAEIIKSELAVQGTFIDLFTATQLSKQLFQFWSERVHVLDLKPGEVAQKYRERYGHPDNKVP